jgi:hypothetical protein
MIELVSVALVLFMIAYGVGFQFEEWRLPGVALVLVGVTLVNMLNLMRARLWEATARIDELEKKLTNVRP